MKIQTSNIKVEFRIFNEENIIKNDEDILNKPIIINNLPVGCITEVKRDGLYYNCIGVIWDRFINGDLSFDESLAPKIEAIRIQ